MEYVLKTEIDAPIDEVFSILSDLQRLPEYVPNIREATPEGDGTVRVRGEVVGHSFDKEACFDMDEAAKTMSWQVGAGRHYRGDLAVIDHGASCFLMVTLHIAGAEEPSDERTAQINRQLEGALDRIKRICESETANADSGQAYLG
ncbi:MAG: hypothetical protein QOJ65_1262 [Fimbriimonadaceae bacterium]|jgi:uncharacterized membrane protein|nr:hypothetical protein [Fimbriimonadaceae bacterium]